MIAFPAVPLETTAPDPIPGYYAVHGLRCSYFTRKVTGHLDHLRQPWFMDPSFGANPLGAWASWVAVPDTLIALLAEAGRHYLPWVARATRDGSASSTFADGSTVEIAATNFVTEARATMLGRYVAVRSPEIDAVLDQAGILGYYADYVDQAGPIPDPEPLPRPADNSPYPAGP